MKRTILFTVSLILLLNMIQAIELRDCTEEYRCRLEMGEAVLYHDYIITFESLGTKEGIEEQGVRFGIDGITTEVIIPKESGPSGFGKSVLFGEEKRPGYIYLSELHLEEELADYILFDIDFTDGYTGRPTSCTDSDNGKDTDIKGTVQLFDIDGNKVYEETDSCGFIHGRIEVREYYCVEKVKEYEDIQCDRDCEDGRCLSDEEVDQRKADERFSVGIQNLHVNGTEIVFDTYGPTPVAEIYLDGAPVDDYETFSFSDVDQHRYFVPCRNADLLEAFSEARKKGVAMETNLPFDITSCAQKRERFEEEQRQEELRQAEEAKRQAEEEAYNEKAIRGAVPLHEECLQDEHCTTGYCDGTCKEGGFITRIRRFFKNLFWKEG